MKLSQNQQKEFQDELQPLLSPFFTHQGWPDLASADTATQVIVDWMRELGVRL